MVAFFVRERLVGNELDKIDLSLTTTTRAEATTMHEKVRALHPAATPRQPDPSLPRLPAAHISRTRLTQALRGIEGVYQQ